jgi:hypothetical protein
MKKNLRTKFVGMDVHQKTISIAIADDGPDREVRLYGTIKNTVEAIGKVIRKLVSTGAELHFVYEAGPCGFALYRHLTSCSAGCFSGVHRGYHRMYRKDRQARRTDSKSS